ncbi:MAG TPA: DUF3826 domain-containing protein [Verrucomicrobiae bacterium]|nr:DUF3826 domain-containing protein [Verrucomicrobiae bacterium]
MKTLLVVLLPWMLFVSTGRSAETPAADAEARYTAAIEGRTAKILKALALTDTNQVAHVHDILMAQWRALRAWHDQNDARLKAARSDPQEAAQIRASLKKLHDEFLARLAQYLTPAQIEAVKDGMTYGVVQATYQAYLEIVPNLTEADKAEILTLLKEGREEAMDAGSAQEKAAIIKKYKGRINNYLDAHGHNVKAAYREWGARQKDRSPATAPAAAKPEEKP